MADTVITPDVQKYLVGLTFPAEKEDILATAEEKGAPDEILDMLDGLPDDEYTSIEDVVAAMDAEADGDLDEEDEEAV